MAVPGPVAVRTARSERATPLGIRDGDEVEIDGGGAYVGRLKAKVTPWIHREAVFMLHGFGHQAKQASRSYNKGVSDALLEENITDMIGGSPALHDTIVTVKPV